MASGEEDFSFPTTFSPPQSVDSPPLWPHTNSEASCSKKPKNIGEDGENIRDGKRRIPTSKNTSHNPRTNFTTDDSTNDEGEKMDILWEDLNEEFSSRTSDMSSHAREVETSCVKTLKLSKAKKKPSIVVFLKVLKRVFVMNNFRHQSIKKRAL
ncbi:uncharacterized protein LOC111386426 [Olea europaea var. sylvestris]|uniref:Uncharacterized protein n=1 Tax=Olea europaea subsp. europaea TaxID=158383 RepID=A0A8S0UC30_OLEEU|nr:uncharacterized protein LOC111386426 [Olea europaea var. sylvestris]CAA3017175.1 Hypothetical predicted protein [Olea europaea subsp. europaea]